MLGTEVCFSTTLHHDGATGYQPYLRILLPPELDGSSLSASFFGVSALTRLQQAVVWALF